jgi:hypothetical protein
LDIQKNNINFKIQTKMKKVFFSAVALVAFSFAGMANEIEEIEISKSKIETETNCNSYAMSSTIAESQYYGYVMTSVQFASSYSFYYNSCVSANNSGYTLLKPVFIG